MYRVECGDYHFGALTASGELYTFGAYSNGALGHGQDNVRLPLHLRTPNNSLDTPCRVYFDRHDTGEASASSSGVQPGGADDEYCFNIAMAGWASSALTVRLHESGTADDAPEQEMPQVRLAFPAFILSPCHDMLNTRLLSAHPCVRLLDVSLPSEQRGCRVA